MNARVQRVGTRIAPAVGDQLPECEMGICGFESKDVNAFALPGGKVGVYTGLLNLAESDSELAIVMGHEIGPSLRATGPRDVGSDGHCRRRRPRCRGWLTTSTTRRPGIFSCSPTVALPRWVGSPAFAPERERSGSHGGRVRRKGGYDPRAAIGFWQRCRRTG